MSSIKTAYNTWSKQYDTNQNKTRDLEAKALRSVLGPISFASVLEIGCGTGKNSGWFVTQAEEVLAVDFSAGMLEVAKAKLPASNIRFVQADITHDWSFALSKFHLISFSLVLEHIENLDFIFRQVKACLHENGYVYIGELHPFKQYQGSLARFETNGGRVELQCYTHHISEFVQVGLRHGFSVVDVNEWFDEDQVGNPPRILSLLFRSSI